MLYTTKEIPLSRSNKGEEGKRASQQKTRNAEGNVDISQVSDREKRRSVRVLFPVQISVPPSTDQHENI